MPYGTQSYFAFIESITYSIWLSFNPVLSVHSEIHVVNIEFTVVMNENMRAFLLSMPLIF